MSDYKPQPLPDWSAIIAEKDALIRRMLMDHREEAGQLWDILALRDEEIKRLRAGGCARDQGTTQYCAEAARLAVENEQNCIDLEEYRRDVERLTAEVERLRKIIQETALHFLMGVDNVG